ncbi:MAG: lactate utilization protein [Rhizobiaceae bacterium]
MSGREAILGRLRKTASGDGRESAVAARLKNTPTGVIPARGQLPPKDRMALFVDIAKKMSASVEMVKTADGVPKAVSAYLRSKNLPHAVRMGEDNRLSAMPWAKEKALELRFGASDGHDEACVSHAFAAIAETGTLALVSGADNPVTLNFLPEHHIVVVSAADMEGDMEAVLARLKKATSKKGLPRTLNLITGPSRSGDIEQTIILGAHGPRALHIIVTS